MNRDPGMLINSEHVKVGIMIQLMLVLVNLGEVGVYHLDQIGYLPFA